ncbi:hypothetical protein [Limnoglobus roseus]|uniref:Uncharacterized protein n=1 Tax=Limnoglobus roseus TaxID=2598579 RepID=A0A5C1AGG8_9BACT|nr:hypothetical protein [Limnoglobus roseus]QEL18519.1 hypothetical protein PX52LOC_05546 [Limnoglobus roseus]
MKQVMLIVAALAGLAVTGVTAQAAPLIVQRSITVGRAPVVQRVQVQRVQVQRVQVQRVQRVVVQPIVQAVAVQRVQKVVVAPVQAIAVHPVQAFYAVPAVVGTTDAESLRLEVEALRLEVHRQGLQQRLTAPDK